MNHEQFLEWATTQEDDPLVLHKCAELIRLREKQNQDWDFLEILSMGRSEIRRPDMENADVLIHTVIGCSLKVD